MLKSKECYLVVWLDPADNTLKHEIVEHDSETMHTYANDRRHELAGSLPEDDDRQAEDFIRVFEVKEPRHLKGSMRLVFEKKDNKS